MAVKPVIAIVDAYSSGNLYAGEFHSRGWRVVHVQSAPDIPRAFRKSFKPDDFIGNVVHYGRFQQTLDAVVKYDPQHVIAGAEMGVLLADRLSEALQLPSSNGVLFSEARRNKFLMQEVIKEKGLRSIEQTKSSDLNELLIWAFRRNRWPMVLKPLDSAGTDGVFFCNSLDEIENAFRKLIGQRNQAGQVNRELLLQEFIRGTEYVVDTVSCQGRHYVTDFIEYRLKNSKAGNDIYDVDYFLPSSGPVQQKLTEYTFRVLDALGIHYGPAHAEVMMVDGEPVLMEIGARLCGAGLPVFFKECMGQGQLELAVDSYINPDLFLERTQKPFSLKKQARVMCLSSDSSGKVVSLENIEELTQLRSYFGHTLMVQPGETLQETRDYFTMPGFVLLANAEEDQLNLDIHKFKELEKKGFFKLSNALQ